MDRCDSWKFSWGRILAATGSVPLSSPTSPTLEIDPKRVSVVFSPADGSEPLHVLTNGEPENVDEERAKEILEMEDINVEVDLKLGDGSATYWTCDFSYVSVNGFCSLVVVLIWFLRSMLE